MSTTITKTKHGESMTMFMLHLSQIAVLSFQCKVLYHKNLSKTIDIPEFFCVEVNSNLST